MIRPLALLLILILPFFSSAQQIPVKSGNAKLDTVSKQNENIITLPVEVLPEFPGGQKAMFLFLTRKFKIPKSVRKATIDGIVVVSFVVKSNGTIENIQCVESPHPDLCEESARVLRLMPKWKPGTQNGIAVDVKYTVPWKIVYNQTKPSLKEKERRNPL